MKRLYFDLQKHANLWINVCIGYIMDVLSTTSLINSKGRHVTPGLGHGLPSLQLSTFPRPLVLLQLCGGQPLRPQGHWLRPEWAETRRHSGPLELWVHVWGLKNKQTHIWIFQTIIKGTVCDFTALGCQRGELPSEGRANFQARKMQINGLIV